MSAAGVAVKDKDIAKYRAVYAATYGVDLDKRAATEQLHRLLLQMQTIYRPITSKQARSLKNENETKYGHASTQ